MKKFFSLVLTMVLMLTLSVSTFATERISVDLPESSNGDVTVISSMDDIGILTTYSIDWNVGAGKGEYGRNSYGMKKGTKIPFNITFSPEAGVLSVGLYNHNTGKYEMLKSATSSPFKGSFEVPADGQYSFAVQNGSKQSMRVKGTYEF